MTAASHNRPTFNKAVLGPDNTGPFSCDQPAVQEWLMRGTLTSFSSVLQYTPAQHEGWIS